MAEIIRRRTTADARDLRLPTVFIPGNHQTRNGRKSQVSCEDARCGNGKAGVRACSPTDPETVIRLSAFESGSKLPQSIRFANKNTVLLLRTGFEGGDAFVDGGVKAVLFELRGEAGIFEDTSQWAIGVGNLEGDAFLNQLGVEVVQALGGGNVDVGNGLRVEEEPDDRGGAFGHQ